MRLANHQIQEYHTLALVVLPSQLERQYLLVRYFVIEDEKGLPIYVSQHADLYDLFVAELVNSFYENMMAAPSREVKVQPLIVPHLKRL